MATRYALARVAGAQPEAFVMVGVDFGEGSMKSISEGMSEKKMRRHLAWQGATQRERWMRRLTGPRRNHQRRFRHSLTDSRWSPLCGLSNYKSNRAITPGTFALQPLCVGTPLTLYRKCSYPSSLARAPHRPRRPHP
jgi:hypothetical protein